MVFFQKVLILSWVCFCVCNLNIHRAVPGSPAHKRQIKFAQKDAVEKFVSEIEDVEDEFSDVKMVSLPWVYALPAAFLVGSTGILPLLVFKVEHGQSMKESISPQNLKILLSFAVGGLLGDVFLHLLPEAWMFLAKDGHDHFAHFKVGIWVIFGFLCFLLIEKIFMEHEKVREHQEQIKEKKQMKIKPSFKQGHASTELKQRKVLIQDAIFEDSDEDITDEYSEGKIKVIGYLNLLANCIDNFTHGLAVAGSFLVSTPVGVCTTFAILLHEVPHEIGDFAILLNAGFSRWDAAKGQLLTASGAVIGCLFGLLAEGAGDSSAWVLPFTSGGFLYIAMVTIVPELQKEESLSASLKQLFSMFAGLSVMGVVSTLH